MKKTETLIQLARTLASEIPNFQAVRGPGEGDRATLSLMKSLRARALQTFGTDFSEKRICGDNAFAVDFYIPDEATIVEVALGLPNPACEFEKDILKAIMAQDRGTPVKRLVFVSRAGAINKCDQPGRKAIREWARTTHELQIEVHELGGEPRVRKRDRRKAVLDVVQNRSPG